LWTQSGLVIARLSQKFFTLHWRLSFQRLGEEFFEAFFGIHGFVRLAQLA